MSCWTIWPRRPTRRNSVASWTSVLKDELPGKRVHVPSQSGSSCASGAASRPIGSPLRDRAVALLPRISGQERIWLHWGMTSLAYPFFRDTAEVVGRLLTLQDDFTTAQVQERLLKKWGDRATTKEAAQKLLNTLVDWEVLRSAKTKGHFLLARKMTTAIPELQLWLLEALLGAGSACRRDRGPAVVALAGIVSLHSERWCRRSAQARWLRHPPPRAGHGYGRPPQSASRKTGEGGEEAGERPSRRKQRRASPACSTGRPTKLRLWAVIAGPSPTCRLQHQSPSAQN